MKYSLVLLSILVLLKEDGAQKLEILCGSCSKDLPIHCNRQELRDESTLCDKNEEYTLVFENPGDCPEPCEVKEEVLVIELVAKGVTNVEVFNNFPNVETLTLNTNQITDVSLLRTSKLEDLHLYENPIRLEIESHLVNINSIKNLQLQSCNITNVYTPTFSNLKNLITLNLGSNSLTNLPADVFDSNPNLTNLNLTNNLLTHFPPNIFLQLANLRILELKHNQINASMIFKEMFVNSSSLNIMFDDNVPCVKQNETWNCPGIRDLTAKDCFKNEFADAEMCKTINMDFTNMAERDSFENYAWIFFGTTMGIQLCIFVVLLVLNLKDSAKME